MHATADIVPLSRFPAGGAPFIGVMAARSFGRRGLSHMAFSLIAAFCDLTGWTDQQVATFLGRPRSTMQAFRTGKLPENLTDEDRGKLLEAARSYRQEVYEAVAKMELYS